MLGSLEDLAPQDLQRCLAKGKIVDPERARWIMQSTELMAWLNDVGSRTLLINGGLEGNATFSATTFIAAKLLVSLETLEPIITLSFFCSLHTTSVNDSEADPMGMVRSFITQLILRTIPWDFTFLEK